MRTRHLFLLLILLFISGCKEKKTASSEGLTAGVLDFQDNFDRDTLGKDWTTKNPKAYRIKDGKLFVQMAHNKGLWLNRVLPPRVRIEFDAIALSKDVDIKCEVFAAKQMHQSGYILILGGWHNQLSIIARLNEHGKDRLVTDRTGEKGRRYHWTIVRTDNRLRWYLDGKLFLEYDDKAPLKGLYFGFNDWEAPVEFDNLRIYRL